MAGKKIEYSQEDQLQLEVLGAHGEEGRTFLEAVANRILYGGRGCRAMRVKSSIYGRLQEMEIGRRISESFRELRRELKDAPVGLEVRFLAYLTGDSQNPKLIQEEELETMKKVAGKLFSGGNQYEIERAAFRLRSTPSLFINCEKYRR